MPKLHDYKDAEQISDTVSIEELGLSDGVVECLQRGGIRKIGDLTKRSPSWLVDNIDGLGWFGAAETESALLKKGRSFEK